MSTTGDGESSTSGTTGTPVTCGNNRLDLDEICDGTALSGESCVSLGHNGGVLSCQAGCDDYDLTACWICGNGVIDVVEDCEPTTAIVQTCQELGFEAGTITCASDCLFDLTECSICGDGIQAGPEDCDGIDFGGEDCQSRGYAGGSLACNLASCTFDETGCS